MSASERTGTAGNDTLLSQAPRDTLVGGTGDDTYDVLHYGTVIREQANGGTDAVLAHIDFTLPDHVEELVLEYADRGHIPNPVTKGPLIGVGNSLDNIVSGNALNNILKGLGGNDTIWGQAGDDWIDGGDGNDIVSGGSGNNTLFGGAGNDTVSGGSGNDILSGGAGDDLVAGFGGRDVVNYDGILGAVGGTHYFVRNADGSLVITSGSDGTDTLTGIEIVTFNLTVVLNSWITASRTPDGFDEKFYLTDNPDVASAVGAGRIASGLDHFQRYGEREGRDPNALFDADYYLAHNSDVAAAVARGQTTAWAHYNNYGWREGRDPSAWFNTRAYMDGNTDVATSGLNPLLHFLHIGAADGRTAQLSNSTLDWIG